jgi:hypothetical protein
MTINDNWFFNGGFLTFKIPNQETYTIAQEAGSVNQVAYDAGDYIITDSSGSVYVIPPTKFNRRNEDLGGGNSMPKKLLNLAKLANEDGVIQTSYGEKNYTLGNQYIILQDPDDYKVLDKAVFEELYDLSAKDSLWGIE